MDRLEPMAGGPECVVGGRMDREYTLHLRCRLATTLLGFSRPGALAGHLSSVVFVLPGWMSSRLADRPTDGRRASQLIGHRLPRHSPSLPSRARGRLTWWLSRPGGA